MQPLVHLLVIVSFLSLVCVWWSRAARGIWAPTTFFGFFTIVFGMPVYLLALQENSYHAESFSEDITQGGLMLALGMYPAALLGMVIESYSRNSKQCFMQPERIVRMSIRTELLLGVAVVLILGIWIFGTPRFGMLKSLLRGLSAGDPAELNFMRRTEYASGLFNQKIFTWLRFSLGPVLSLTINEVLRFRIKAPFRWVICYIVYFLFSAAFHKSTWVLGFAFIALNEFFALRRGLFSSRILAVAMIVLSSTAGGLMALAYALQYRANTSITIADHLRQGFTRVFGCTNDGIFTFTYVFPDRVAFMPSAAFLGPFATAVQESPERLSALALGADSTIQPGLLGSLFAGGGTLCIPIYIGIVLILGLVANSLAAQLGNPTLFRIFAPTLVVGLMWILHNPLYPCIFGSGFFMSCLFSAVVGQLWMMHRKRQQQGISVQKVQTSNSIFHVEDSGTSLITADESR